ncbi:selenophosphate synthase [Thermodesulfobium acidiphilum]|uniref:Selenophosphate synthase n=1 Tax=Thermodesulfobium acidiphilum TaxID=1794699 RepID=A0A2R4W220_THEAF|nr:selenophosphate synthase [Thermodesulfobium acidiphilum]
MVNSPDLYGKIAAANSLSDLYAVGAKPITALNILGFPRYDIELNVINEILRGSHEKVKEAGALILGGHSMDDIELKYGLSVTGIAKKEELITHNNAQPGDIIILTKPLGTGILTSALKIELIDEIDMQDALNSMQELNYFAGEAQKRFKASSGTDVTGFGLIGHAINIAKSSNVIFEIFSNSLPIFERVLELADEGVLPAGIFANIDFYKENVVEIGKIQESYRYVIYDPQTSGGLLSTYKPDVVDDALRFLINNGVNARIIGVVKNNTVFNPGTIVIKEGSI